MRRSMPNDALQPMTGHLKTPLAALGGVAIDLRAAAMRISGIERFALNLALGLSELSQAANVAVIVAPEQRSPAPTLRTLTLPPAGPKPWRQRADARAFAAEGIHTVVSPDIFAPLPGLVAPRQRQVVTLHDLTPLRIPEHLKGAKKVRFAMLWRWWLKAQIRAAWRVLTVSEHAAGDIASMFPEAAAKLRIVANSVVVPADSGRAPGSDGRFRLLFVGRADGNKNLETCIELLAALVRNGVDAELQIVGAPDLRYANAAGRIERYGLADRVLRPGYVDDAALNDAYRRADLFVFLSRYEGFGLPPLEAMARGVPVLSSNRAALPEVLGDAALFVDPDDVDGAVDASLRVLREPGLAAELATRGRARAERFTLRRQAEALLAAISEG